MTRWSMVPMLLRVIAKAFRFRPAKLSATVAALMCRRLHNTLVFSLRTSLGSKRCGGSMATSATSCNMWF